MAAGSDTYARAQVPPAVVPPLSRWRAGDRNLSLRDRLERRIIRPRYPNGAVDYDQCHDWIGARSQSGFRAVWYPVLYYQGRVHRVNRLVLILEYGPRDVPKIAGENFDTWFARALVYYRGRESSHDCDQSECANFTHLMWRGHAANIAEQTERRRLLRDRRVGADDAAPNEY